MFFKILVFDGPIDNFELNNTHLWVHNPLLVNMPNKTDLDA